MSHEEATMEMGKMLRTVEYFREFDSVLNKVFKQWEVADV
jgi:hypothetical protein